MEHCEEGSFNNRHLFRAHLLTFRIAFFRNTCNLLSNDSDVPVTVNLIQH